jgi:hypothetical protein
MYICHACQRELTLKDKPGRRDYCPHCEADLHCCLNCRFYNPTLSNQCQETQAEWVVDKERANFCDYFVFKDSLAVQQREQGRAETRSQFEALFGKSQEE